MKYLTTSNESRYFYFQREEPGVMFANYRANSGASGDQISYTNDKKVTNVKSVFKLYKILEKPKI